MPINKGHLLAYVDQILSFSNQYNYRCSESLCQALLNIADLPNGSVEFSVVHFLWAEALFHQGRLVECISVCDAVAESPEVRCKYLRCLCLFGNERYAECIESCKSLFEHLPVSPADSHVFGIAKEPPTAHSLYSLLANCFRKAGNLVECAFYSKLAFCENSFDLITFERIVQHSFDKSITDSSVCIISEERLRPIECDFPPAVRDQLVSTPALEPESQSKRPRKSLGVPKGAPEKKPSFQKRLFPEAEENNPNIQAAPKFTQPSHPSSSFITQHSSLKRRYFSLLYHYRRKDYAACLLEIGDESQSLEASITPSMLSLVGCSLYENLFYDRARPFFEKIFTKFAPFSCDLQFYSSTLWHLRDTKALGTLTKHLMGANAQSDIAWICYGNYASLKKETSTSIKAFQRAIELNKDNANAHTLLAYEYLGTDELQKAVDSFLLSYKLFPSYKALFGISLAAMKQRQWEKAEKYLRKALDLNPTNSVIWYYLGMVCEEQDRNTEAISHYTQAIAADANNFTPRYKRARLLLQMGMLSDALRETQSLVELGDGEPSAYTLLGKVCRELGDAEGFSKYSAWGIAMPMHSEKKAPAETSDCVQ